MVWQSGAGKCRHGQGSAITVVIEDSPDNIDKKRRRHMRSIFYPLSLRRLHQLCGMKLIATICFILLLLVAFVQIAKQGRAEHHLVVKVVKPSNLNRLDNPTRMVGGVRQLCLQLLPEHEIEELQLPPAAPSVVKELQYVTGDQHFAGVQTPSQRLTSFDVKNIMQLHCGWCSGSGFDIDTRDQEFMKSVHVVVITCTFGGGDNLYQPIGFVNATLSKVKYVAFWDEVTKQKQEEAGNIVGEDRMVGLWRVVLVRNLPFADQRKNGKIPKMLGHRLFPNARFSIWTDSKSQFRRDPMGVLEALLWRPKADFAISEHGARKCVYKEGVAIVQKHKATPEEVAKQLDAYRSEGMPEDFRLDGHKALGEASVIVREHTPATNYFMCAWFNEVMHFTARDQLSFPYMLYRLRVLHLNMFPVCTRKALVNSLGHVGKAKLLVNDG